MSRDGAALAATGEMGVIAWTGTNAEHNLNVAVLAPLNQAARRLRDCLCRHRS